jgi:hypothetical protein
MDLTPYYFHAPHAALPAYVSSEADLAFHGALLQALQTGVSDADELQRKFLGTGFPKDFPRLILVMYAPGHRRILVTRPTPKGAVEFLAVFQRLLEHPRRAALAAVDFRLQMDFVDEPPWPVDFFSMGMEQLGERHFEIGLDGLLIRTPENKLQVFTPGDGYVRSVMGMGQLRDYLFRAYGEETVRKSSFHCFRSASFISTRNGWRALYRGHPVVGALTRDKLEEALHLAIEHIKKTQQPDGRFLYYYDAALDSRLDHEHPKRDPDKNPYYNILRHGGGALTCLFHERHTRRGDTWEHMRGALDYLVAQARLQDYQGREGAYIYSEKKSKLGGSGIALYALSQFERASADKRYRVWADRLAWHLINQITASGEFIYYNIYLDKPISEADNANYFSFFYPGEAICGLAAYLHLLTPAKRRPIFKALHKALEFLLIERPIARASEYSAVPSDGWLMMGIMELWDFKEMQRPLYADFVFSDAQQMIDHMYKVTDAPYPDYAGGFYYNYGDYPYADGARCEGLLGAYELAVKMGNQEKAGELWKAMQLAAWALLHLVNTEDSLYFAPNPTIALGGIRFKYTRQWFRIDTIQHVASFFAKMLPYWEANNPAEPAP